MAVEEPEYLLVIFEGFNTTNKEHYKELVGKKTAVLWINERKKLYLGEQGREVCLSKIQNLIQDKLEVLNLSNYRLIMAGDDIGANVALILGTILDAKHLIVNKPIENIGDFINNFESYDIETIFNNVFGETKLNKVHELNTLFNNKINTINYPLKAYINTDKLELFSRKDIFSQKYDRDFYQVLLDTQFVIEEEPILKNPTLRFLDENLFNITIETKNWSNELEWAFYLYKNNKKVYVKMYNKIKVHEIELEEIGVNRVRLFLKRNEKIVDVKNYYIS